MLIYYYSIEQGEYMLKNWQSEVLKATINEDLANLKQLFAKADDNDKQSTDEQGRTFLHFVRYGKKEYTLHILQFLLDSDLDPLAVDENFENAMDLAKKSNNIPAFNLMKFFVHKKNQKLQEIMS